MKIYLVAAALVFFAPPANAALTVAKAPSQHVSCSAGICVATAADATLNLHKLETMLAAGNVTVESASTAEDIVIAAGIAWSSASTLALDSYRSVTVTKPISIAGTGGLSLVTNDGGSGGVLLFQPNGRVGFADLSSPLSIDGQSFLLVNSIASLAGAVAGNPNGFYALANDYDAAADGTYSASPVSTTFNGTFQGLGNTINHLKIDDRTDDSFVGLFATLGQNGAVNGLRLENVNVKGKRSRLGGILGGNGDGSLTNDAVSGSIQGTGHSWAGGVVGWTSSIAYSSSSAEISVDHRGGAAGGLGAFVNTVTFSFATGNVVGGVGFYLGGLIGEQDLHPSSIENSYATGTVTGGIYSAVGGVIGAQSGQYSNEDGTSYSTGAVSGGTARDVGGFAGGAGATFSDCYWDITTSGTTDGDGGGNETGLTGLTTSQLQAGLPAGFDPTIWAESPNINGGFPYLIANPPPA